MKLPRVLDLPPVWLALFIALGWMQSRWLPVGVAGLQWRGIGAVMVGFGLLLTLVAAIQFLRHRTSIIPGHTPDALITGGIYQLSRNPIYLADVLILSGACLWMGALLGLVLAPVFILLIQRRFILPEEQRLRAAFGTDFDRYSAEVRRWI